MLVSSIVSNACQLIIFFPSLMLSCKLPQKTSHNWWKQKLSVKGLDGSICISIFSWDLKIIFFLCLSNLFYFGGKEKKGVSNHYSKFLMELLIVINKLKNSLFNFSILWVVGVILYYLLFMGSVLPGEF